MSYIISVANYFVDHPILMVLAIIIYMVIFGLSLVFFGKGSSPNPFMFDARKNPELRVINQAERNKVLKQGFSERSIPENLDAIVIGSGIGGLSAAAILSKAGKRVLVLEQHDQAGGCCHTFIEKDFEFDVGIHYIGEMKTQSTSKFLLDQISNGQILWDHLDIDFDVVALPNKDGPDKYKYIPIRGMGYAAFKKKLLEHFPDEEQALDKYIELLKQYKSSPKGFLYFKMLPKWLLRLLIATKLIYLLPSYFHLLGHQTVDEVLDGLTQNKDLKTVLCYNFFDYGVEPARSSFVLHTLLMNHYLKGASYPNGGSSEFAFHILPVIEKSGGRVLVRARVSEILVEDGAVAGVRVKREGDEHTDIRCKVVISDVGVVNTFVNLLPQTVAEKTGEYKLIKKNQVQTGALSCASLFVGLNGSGDQLKLPNYNIWCFNCSDISKTISEYATLTLDEAINRDIPVMFIGSPSTKDTLYQSRHPGKSTMTIIIPCKWDWFAKWDNERVKKRGEDYESVKKQFMDKIWDNVLKLYPHLEDKVEYMELGTSVTNNYYLGTIKGEVYGLDHIKSRFDDAEVVMNLRSETGVKGLFLTGQDLISCGFVPSMFSGLMTASIILNRNLYKDLTALWNKVKDNKNEVYKKIN